MTGYAMVRSAEGRVVKVRIPPRPMWRPRGVPIDLHDEIMRRIRNRWYEQSSYICSMRRRGPGLVEMAGILPLVSGLPKSAILFYKRQLMELQPLFRGCMPCSAKLYAFIYLLSCAAQPKSAMIWLARVRAMEHRTRRRRDFVDEILNTPY
ncbi:MAG TPA: hypothetical protein PKE26_05100 [Kiritimatiellia bacterium]|nr:hypothetical protein [Kiritimatiellia bacterium]HMO98469.1 hypothetical protein [Kiritimatiellia bacterium]